MKNKKTIKIKKVDNKNIETAFFSKLTLTGDTASAVSYYSNKIPPSSYWRGVEKQNKFLNECLQCLGKTKNCYYKINEHGQLFFKHMPRNKIGNKGASKALKTTIKRFADAINTNITKKDVASENVKFITLTYKENMTDVKKLYFDFDNFLKKLKYHFKTELNIDFKTVVWFKAIEPQGRGAWHIHLILKTPYKIFLDNNTVIWGLWEKGFTSTRAIKKNNNVGLYITSYLTNFKMKVKPAKTTKKITAKCLHIENKKTTAKIKTHFASKKGERLKMYPPHLKIFSSSRNAIKPAIIIDYHGENKNELEKMNYKKINNIKQKAYKIDFTNEKGEKKTKTFYYENYKKE